MGWNVKQRTPVNKAYVLDTPERETEECWLVTLDTCLPTNIHVDGNNLGSDRDTKRNCLIVAVYLESILPARSASGCLPSN